MKHIRELSFVIIAAFATAVMANAATPPPTGDWDTFLDQGNERLLHVVINSGTVTGWMCPGAASCGTVFPQFCLSGLTSCPTAIKGFWDDTAGKLTFYRVTNLSNVGGVLPNGVQFYTGYVSSCSSAGELCIDGFVEAFGAQIPPGPLPFGSPTHNIYGWKASHN